MSTPAHTENFQALLEASDQLERAVTVCRRAKTSGQLTAGECAELTLLVRQANCAVTELHNRLVIGLPPKPLAP